MGYMKQEEVDRLLAVACTVHREEHGSVTLTYGYLESMGQREYFSLIDDTTLPGPWLYWEH